MDLGATSWTTFRLVTFPLMRSALVAGAILAFGLSFLFPVVLVFLELLGLITPQLLGWIAQDISARVDELLDR